jgi:hypothetical protein
VLLLLAATALCNSGCVFVAAGAAAGGATAGYLYYRGRLYRDFPANLNDAAAAVRLALVDLKFPITSDSLDGGKIDLKSRTADGSKIHINLETVTSRIPAEGTVTRVSIRVGNFGDDDLTKKLLDQIGFHLVVPPSKEGPPPPAAVPVFAPVGKPPETHEPPGLPAEPKAIK